MGTSLLNLKMINTGILALLILAILTGGYFFTSTQLLTKNLNDEKLNSEMLLSEKLAVQKELESFKNQMTSLNGKNSELDNLLAQANKKLSDKESELNRVKRENTNVKQLNKQLADLAQMKKDFESQILALNESIQKLQNEKKALNQTIESLQDENKKLAANLKTLRSITKDNYLVETMKRKDRLTIVAKRTKKMALSFKIPDNVSEDISFRIIRPDGKTIEGKENGISYHVVPEEDGLTASLASGMFPLSKKIELIYEPKEKQKPGLYKIEMYNKDISMGTFNVKLQ